ncbi:cellulose biosynthesis protein BcsC [Pseudomonas abieticivorans]|uniref:cellulose biosynthesis protein BcsC n=1 Tax=Pseudomonas abieticivorans TaxID=2931382 RepID=UPI0020C047F3|nr:cellulose biosynthesis protein BcsC [Pseudomonas sp. PIA16]
MPPHYPTLTLAIVCAWLASPAHAAQPSAQLRLIEQGQYWQQHDNPQRATEVWNKLLLLDPRQPDALYGLGLIGVQQGNADQARQSLVRLQALQPPTRLALQLEQDIRLAQPQSQERLKEARRLVDAGARGQATALYRELLQGRPAQGLLAREYFNNLAFNDGDWPEAKAGFERLIREMPDDSIVPLFYAKQQVRREDSRAEGIRALQQLTQRVDIAGDADESWRLALTWMGPPEPAQRPLFEAFLKAHPDDAAIRAQLDKGLQQAAKAHAPAAKAKPEPVTVQPQAPSPNGPNHQELALRATQQAAAAERRGDREGARQALQQALTLEPDNVWTRFALARIYLSLNQPQQAKALLDVQLKNHPASPDALYASALLNVQTGDYTSAQANLARVLPAQRTPDMQALATDINLNIQVGQALDLANRGQRSEALTLLDRLQPTVVHNPDRVASLAGAYLNVGDTASAHTLMREQLQGHAAPSADFVLQYASMLLASGDVDQVQGIIQQLQGQPLNAASGKRLDDVQQQLRIAQADQLRNRGDLAGAYEVLAPVLAQHPDNIAAVSALARMYSAHGETSKALALYKALLQRQQGNAALLLTAADAGLQAKDRPFAEDALARWQKINSATAASLAEAARLYQLLGHNGTATDLLRRAVALEHNDSRSRPDNPVTGLPTSNPFSQAATNPFRSAAPLLDNDSPAQQALDTLLRERSAYVRQGLSIRSNDSEAGLSKLTDIQAPLEIDLPVGDDRVALRVTPVSLNAGSANSEALARFGTAADSGSPGSQKAQGTGVALAWKQPGTGLRTDLGITPLGFEYSTAVGGISIERPLSDEGTVHYGINVSRRAVTDSVTAFAGTTDKREGLAWGGVTANGARGQLNFDDGDVGAYGYASWYALVGHHVENNQRRELGGGVYGYLQNATDRQLTLGLSLTGMSYANNQDYFTYGHGGYFSPQTFFALGIPLTWAQRSGRLSYLVKGSVGVQHLEQDGADYFPTDSARQASSGLTYSGQSKTGIGYSLAAAAEYRVGNHIVLGANLGLDNARDYQQVSGALSLRYLLEPNDGPLALPISPYASPYAN